MLESIKSVPEKVKGYLLKSWQRPPSSKDQDFEQYIALEHQNPTHNEFMVINWCVGNLCNYSCSYCPPSLHRGSTPFVTYEVAVNFAKQVFEHYSPIGKKFYFEFTGGEVSLWKDFLKVAEFLKEQDARVGLISNGSKAMYWWEKARPLIDHVCLSYHPESAKDDHFVEVVKHMVEDCRTHVNIMMLPDRFSHCYEVAHRVKDIGNLSMAMQPLIKDFATELYDYTPEQKEILENQYSLITQHIQHTRSYETYRGAMNMVFADGQKKPVAPHKFIASGNNSWKNWNCHVGLEQLVVDQDGSILRGWCLAGGKIGKVGDAEIQFPKIPIKCPKDFCHCNFDIMAKKERRKKKK